MRQRLIGEDMAVGIMLALATSLTPLASSKK
jgi:hypothetical protein